jgi:hypothetical protein
MSKNYVLNDLEYDNVPLKIILPFDSEKCDEKELQKSRERNRKLIERMRNDKKYRELVSAP